MFNITIKVERWKFNKEFGTWVSSEGRFKNRHKQNLPIKIASTTGYCLVKTEQGYVLAHRLVMFTFRPIPNRERMTVDHLNHNKRDNSLSNLEWVTMQENKARAYRDLYRTEDDIVKHLTCHRLADTLHGGYEAIDGKEFESIESAIDALINFKIVPALNGDPAKVKATVRKKIINAVREKKPYANLLWS